jgi:hypothetical protein
MAVNYLPFIRQEVLLLVGGARGYTRLPIFGAGYGKRVFLGDMDIWGTWTSGATAPVLARIGVLGYKYFTEDFIRVTSYQNGLRPGCMTWKFPRPYRLLPGQKMRATYRVPDTLVHVVSVMFNGVREKDGQPIMLYDSYDVGDAGAFLGMDISLDKEAMHCPSDSSILLYSVTFPEWIKHTGTNPADIPRVQIYGPDDRNWLEWSAQPAAAAAPVIGERLIEPAVTKIILGEQNGWILTPSQTLTVDLLSPSTPAAGFVYVTIRGCVEVEA